MLKINRILYTTDFSTCAKQALPHALFLAKKYNAELNMLHAIVLHSTYDPHNPASLFKDVEAYYNSIEEVANEQSDTILQSYDVKDIALNQVLKRGIAPAPVILEFASENDIDLIVMGTHGRRGLEHIFLGSVAEEVIRFSDCPVLTIREQVKTGKIETKENILVPIDFSKHGENALIHAKHIAATYRSKLHLLHVVEETVHPSFYVTGRTSIFDHMPKLKERCETNLKKIFQESSGPEVPYKMIIVEGKPARSIIEYAENQKINMIVMATHGLTGLDHFLMGSVAEKVTRRAGCPVLTIQAFGKSLL